MAYNPILPTEVIPGEPVTSEVLDKVRSNQNEFDSRITSLEGGGNTVYPPLVMRIAGNYKNEPTSSTSLLTTANFNLTVTGVFLTCETAGSSGTTEIDIQYKRGAAAWQSILSTLPSVAYSAGNLATSTNAVLNPTYVEIEAGDFIRLVVTAKQGGNPYGILARIDYNKA